MISVVEIKLFAYCVSFKPFHSPVPTCTQFIIIAKNLNKINNNNYNNNNNNNNKYKIKYAGHF